MKHSYTFNFLINYLYGEHRILRKLEIENRIAEDSKTRQEYLYLKDAFELLPRISFSPSDKTLKAILDYSRTSSLNPSY